MIEIRDLSVRFGDKIVLDHFNADLPDMGCVVIRGDSGVGKTTLLRVLAGTLRQDSGTILGMENRKRSVAFQEPRLLPWKTALENASLASDMKQAEKYLAVLSMQNELYTRADKLSGGQQQRVSLARAFAFSNDIVLLDEPFNGLDEQNRQRAAELFRTAKLCIAVLHHEDEERLLNPDKKIRL